MSLPMAPAPKSPLARYRLLSPTAAVRVSPLCLGAMNFGNAWKEYMGECMLDTGIQKSYWMMSHGLIRRSKDHRRDSGLLL